MSAQTAIGLIVPASRAVRRTIEVEILRVTSENCTLPRIGAQTRVTTSRELGCLSRFSPVRQLAMHGGFFEVESAFKKPLAIREECSLFPITWRPAQEELHWK